MLIDTHCHLHDREFFAAEQAEEMLERALAAGVERVICIGTSEEDSVAAREFASRHDGVYWTYGVHPENTNGIPAGVLPDFSFPRLLPDGSSVGPLPSPSPSSCIGIGEVGLDYHYEGYDRGAQIRLFEEMLQLAVDNDLPVSFHVREAFDDFFPVVANFPGVRGVVHSFTDSKKTLRRVLTETDFYVGVNGLATYSTLPLPPLERILLETDAPFLTPVPFRGEKNEPAHIVDIADWLAQRLDLTRDEVATTTTKNASNLFKLTF